MGLPDLLARLESEVGEKAEQLRREATARASARVAAAEADFRAALAVRLADAEAEFRADTQRILGRAREAARERVLRRRQGWLDDVFQQAQARLETLASDAAFGRWFDAEVGVALALLGGVPAILRCRPELAVRARAVLAGLGAEVTVTPDAAMPLGFVLTTVDGAIAVDGTLARRLERRRGELAIATLRRLEEVT